MKTPLVPAVVILFVITGTFLDLSSSPSLLANNPAAQEKSAEEVYRNIQALKGMPASQLQQVMALFTGSLGVKCNHCHTNPFDKDDKPTKQTARRMIKMVLDLNSKNFGGQDALTCYTCHRGSSKPDSVLALGKNLFLPQSVAATTDLSLTVDQILERYVRALGGRDLLQKFTTRVSKGSRIGADGVMVPEEVYQKAPNKLLIITRYPEVAVSLRVVDQRGWARDRDKENEITGDELAELTRDATFYKEISLKELYSGMNVGGKATVGERECYVIEAISSSGNLEKLYFDTQTGLLTRRYRESKTMLGPFPLQVDFEDYQVVGGVKIPMTIRWSMPGRVWGRRIAEVKHNVPIEDETFSSATSR